MIRVITRGDDAGSSVSANKAIREAFERGMLRNVSVLATGPAIEDAARRLAGLEGLACGLHATVTSEWEHPRWSSVLPPETVPGLLDGEGMLHRQVTPLHERQIDPSIVMAEIAAQLERLRALGFEVRYVDAHMGFTWLEGVGPAMKDLARREGLVYEPPVGRLPDAAAESRNADHASRLAARLAAAGDGTYLVVGHPTYDDDEMRACHGAGCAPGTVGVDRDGQRQMFVRADVLAVVRDRGIVPIRYDEV